MSDSQVLDLDALMAKKHTVKFEGQNLEVLPPKMRDMIAMAQLGKKLSEADPETMPEEEADKLEQQMKTYICRVIPGLEGKEIPLAHLMGLLNFIIEIGMPEGSETKPVEDPAETAKKDQ